jgi:aryl-alcohol dehydrogenase-like predicted oxidoreductase
VLNNPAVTGAIVGVRAPGQVLGLAGAADFSLRANEVEEIEAVFAKALA